MLAALPTVVGDVLVLAGLAVITLGVFGMYRLPDVYTQLQAAAKATSLGIATLLLAAVATLDGEIVARALLVAAFILFTTPVAAHAIGRSARLRGEPLETAGGPERGEVEAAESQAR
jgi:multicomponent Na+:H+ antiporter subunit G